MNSPAAGKAMRLCDLVHRDYDRFANKNVNVGELPPWMHIQGKVVWYVFQGPYSGLSEAWATFHRKVVASKRGEPYGPPGDVFVCDPDEHKADPETLTTILFMPLKP